MLTRISLITAAIIAAVNVAVLFGVNLNDEQIAGINTLLVAIGAAIHGWYNPNVPVGVQEPPS